MSEETNVKFVSYNGKFPNLCSGELVLEIDGKECRFDHCLCSGGSVFFDSDWNDYVTSGPWSVTRLPEEYEKYKDEIERLVNENVPWGCCGGCV